MASSPVSDHQEVSLSMEADALRELESALDPAPRDGNKPPSPQRGPFFSQASLKSKMEGWSPHVQAGANPGADMPTNSMADLVLEGRDPGSIPSSKGDSSSLYSRSAGSAGDAAARGAPASSLGRPGLESGVFANATASSNGPQPSERPLTQAELKAKKKAEKKARAEAFARANPNVGEKKSKPKLTKAERRAKQEAQRAAKAAAKEKGDPVAKSDESEVGRNKKGSSSSKAKTSQPTSSNSAASANADDPDSSSGPSSSTKSVRVNAMFSHLKVHLRTPAPHRPRRFAARGSLHPAISRIGLMFSQGAITGGNARCVALLQACQEVIIDYVVPPSEDFCRSFLEHLNQSISFIVSCRPMNIPMGNAIRYLKRIIASPAARQLGEDDVRQYLCAMIDEFIDKRIKTADELIMRNLLGLEPHTTPKIVDGDVVLTYGRSHVVEEALKYAHSLNTRFRVVVVDSRPKMEGRGLLKSFAEHGIQCTYVLLSALSYVMKDVTKVILGASSMMANGTALSRVGTAVVAMMAHTQRRPVIFCCETYKFSERVQMDSIVSNEVADPIDLVTNKDGAPTLLSGWEEKKNLGVLNLSYDLTPQEFITVIVTDVGNIPTTSVPVIIREFIAEGSLDAQ